MLQFHIGVVVRLIRQYLTSARCLLAIYLYNIQQHRIFSNAFGSTPSPPLASCPQVVLLAPEAKNPARDVPRALFASLMAVTVVCALASVALAGAEAAPDLDADSAFAEAFRRRGLTLAYKVHTFYV